MDLLTSRGILDAPLSRGMTLRGEIELLRAEREGRAVDTGLPRCRRSRKLTPARFGIMVVTCELLKGAVLSGALVIDACTGLCQEQGHTGDTSGRLGNSDYV